MNIDPYTFKDLVYTTQPSVNLICPICIAPFTNAESIECGHTFCAECLEKATQTRFVCPSCRLQYTRAPVPAYAVRGLVDELLVQCVNVGCLESVQRQNLAQHCYDECMFRLTTCTHCDLNLVLKDLDQHLKSCPVYLSDRHFQPLADDQVQSHLTKMTYTLNTLQTTFEQHSNRMNGIEHTMNELLDRSVLIHETQDKIQGMLTEIVPCLLGDIVPSISQLKRDLDQHLAQNQIPPAVMFDQLRLELDVIRSSLARLETGNDNHLPDSLAYLHNEVRELKYITQNLKSNFAFMSSRPPSSSSKRLGSGMVSGDTKL